MLEFDVIRGALGGARGERSDVLLRDAHARAGDCSAERVGAALQVVGARATPPTVVKAPMR